MDKRFWAVIGIIVVIFGGIFYFNSRSNREEAADRDATPTNHVIGATDAKVKLVEYGDFQCPVCGTYYPVVEQVKAKYKDVMQFQFRHLPLTSIHQNAFAASRAAEAASNQGKFWEMYQQLYLNQQSWSQGNAGQAFKAYAQQIGLDGNRFDTDAASAATNSKIRADQAEASKLKLDSTPSFIINDRKIELSSLVDDTTKQPSLAKFSQVIDPLLKQEGVAVPDGSGATQPAATGSDATTPDTNQ